MALIHWWPLNGDTKDYGANPKHGSLIDAASVTTTDGKIGKCLTGMTGSQTTAGVTVPNCNLLDEISTEYSASVWFKPKGTHVHYEGAFISSGDWNNKRWTFGISQDNTKIQPLTNGSNSSFIALGKTLTTGQWYHAVTVYKGDKAYLYLDGVLINSVTATAPYQSSATNLTIGRETYANGYFSFNGDINDVRIYDHALSMREIEELYNGCILHYNFEDPYIASATNLLTSVASGGRTTLSNGVITATGENLDTYFYLKLAKTQMVAGETYTLSCDADLPYGTRWRFGLGHQSSSQPNFTIYNGHNRYTFVADSTCAAQSSITMDDILETTLSPRALFTGEATKMYNFQLTKTNYEVPYLGGFDITNSKHNIPDSSGYRNTSTHTNLELSEETTKGILTANFKGSAYTTRASLPSTVQTIAMWVKVDTYPSANQVVFADYGSKLAFGFYNTSYAIITCGSSVRYVSNVKSLWKTGKWNYVVVTKDNSGVFHCYINGTECSYTSSNSWTHNGGYFTVGCRYNSGYTTYFTGKIADIKAYVNPLSLTQVKTEYNSQLRLLNNHSVSAMQVKEITNNMAAKMNEAIFKKSLNTNGVSGYTQGHCKVTLTDDGFRIYRTPNLTQANDGKVMYGGMKLQFLNLGHTRTVSYTNSSTGAAATYSCSDFFQKGHRYRISFHVKGHTHNAPSMGFTNNMGWGGGGLSPSPSNIISTEIGSNFGLDSSGNVVGAEKECFYEFTINDDVYKPCTSAYSSFTLGTMYPSYRDFQLQFEYGTTGANGTDIYITNIVCEDITSGDTYKVDPDSSAAIMNADTFYQKDYKTTPIRFGDSGNIIGTNFVESGTILGVTNIQEKLNSRETSMESLNLNKTETKILNGTIANNTTSTDLVTAAQIKTYIDSILNN